MFEAFDDETVVVNMERGHYFALSGLSAKLWDSIVSGQTHPSALASMCSIHEPAVVHFLRLLAQEGLIEGHTAFETVQEPVDCLAGTPFAGTLERFTDVEELLLADPIHDFDAGGWSQTRQQ